ncbi:MAG: DUF4833 domain-containing protein [Chitinophagaceae bacterium]
MKANFIIIPAFLIACICNGQSADSFPVPKAHGNYLFYLQRTPNSNTVIYELNLKNGAVDPDNPVHVFWIRYADKGQQQELNSIQKKIAYGIQTKKLSASLYEINIVSYKKLKMWLENAPGDKWLVYTYINEKKIIVTSIFVKINGGTFWAPKIEYVEMRGTDPATNEFTKTRFNLENN